METMTINKNIVDEKEKNKLLAREDGGDHIKVSFFNVKGEKIESHYLPIILTEGCLMVPAVARMIHVCFHLDNYTSCDNCHCTDDDNSDSSEEEGGKLKEEKKK